MKRITLVAKNNVEVDTVHFDEKVNGEEVIVHTESYGQSRIDDERTASEARTVALDAFDVDVEKAKEVAIRAKLVEIQNEMDKEKEK